MEESQPQNLSATPTGPCEAPRLCVLCSAGLAACCGGNPGQPHRASYLFPVSVLPFPDCSGGSLAEGWCRPASYGASLPPGCPKGFYGKHCRKKCNCANRGRCHRLYGACLCDPGLYGRFCHLGEPHCSFQCPH
ncbi:hypothetical protein P7K49_015235 [Saguinus oedipus]|uniref:EGF-like domain-containing protein n=1 Tax=Saguinus oedipus TaxID=9490 RepID=A0ABQ9V8Z5_SAGOE|nr:hypothetical protein P7K49_015235 [Saguinus oedipus]